MSKNSLQVFSHFGAYPHPQARRPCCHHHCLQLHWGESVNCALDQWGAGVRGDAKTNSHLTSGPYHAMLHSKVTPSLPQPSKLQCYIVLGTWLHVHNTITCQTKLSKRRVRLSCATAVRKCRRVRANSNLTSGTRPNSFSNLALNLSSWCLLTTGNFSADRSHRREIPDTMGEFDEEEKKTEGQDD